MDSESFGKMIKAVLIARGITQKELAKMSEIDQYHISKIINGKGTPSWYTMMKILNALKVDMKLVERLDPDAINDNQGNNGPLRAIRPEDVLMKLNELATGGFLAEEWRDVIMDAFTLIWMRYE